MTPDRLTERMHAVLDGMATPGEARALEAVLAVDAEAAAEFESWKAMFVAMKKLPMSHPPEGLVAAIDKKVPADGQLSTPEFVFASEQTRTPHFSNGLRTFFRRPSRSDTTGGYGHMNTNRKIWAGGAIAVVALGVVIFATGFPPKPENVTGTVMPAERYRAPQAGAEAIKLGEPTPGVLTAAPKDIGGVQAAKSEANLSADRSAAMTADKSANLAADRSAAMTADKSANLTADRAAAKSADKSANLAADRSAALTADKSVNLTADRAAAKSADKAANLSADRSAALTADKAANLSADRAAALTADRAAAKSAEKAANLQAEKAAAEKKADKATTN